MQGVGRGGGQREVVLVLADVAAVQREQDEGDQDVEEGGDEEGNEDGLEECGSAGRRGRCLLGARWRTASWVVLLRA